MTIEDKKQIRAIYIISTEKSLTLLFLVIYCFYHIEVENLGPTSKEP